MTDEDGIGRDLDGSSSEWHAPHNPWLIALVATIATFMEVLDTTIVNVSLPHIAGNLGAEPQDSTYVLTSYLVSNAIVLPLSAWMSSVMGRRNFYLLCILVFTVSSFLCGIAPSLSSLVFFRLLQGVGGGGLQPITQAILIDTFPPRHRAMSMALFGMTVITAPIIGPTLGGWITDNFDWRWVFFINVPVGIFALIVSSRLISDPPFLVRRRGKDRFRIDFVGLGLISVGIGALQMMLDLGERYDWFASNFITTCALLAVFGLGIGIVWELFHKDPIVDFRLLRDRNFGLSVVVMLIFGAGLYASTAVLPLFMQTMLGYSATWSGLAISPGGVIVMFMMPLVGWAVGRFDARVMIAIGMTTIALSLVIMGFFNTQVDFWTIANARILQGFGLAFIFVPLNSVAYGFIKKENRNSASSIINLARNIGGSVGIALVSTIVTRQSQVHQVFVSEHISPYNPEAASMLSELTRSLTARFGDPVAAAAAAKQVLYGMVQEQSHMLAFADAFRFVAPLMLVAIPFILFMRKPPKVGGDIAAH